MQGFQPYAHNRTQGLPNSVPSRDYALFTPGFGLALAAVLLAATAYMLLHSSSAAAPNVNDAKTQQTLVDSATGATLPQHLNAAGHSTTANTTFSSTTADGSTSTYLSVNGQDVTVPDSGSTHQTTVSQDGTRTSVDASRSQSSVSNTSTVNIHVQSSSSGGTSQ